MRDLWAGLPVFAQEILILLGWIAPGLVLGTAILRGFAPWPLVRAMLVRFRRPVALFVVLVAVSVGTGIGLVAQERALRGGTAAAADKFDLIVAAPGSEITALIAAVFLQPSDIPLLDGATYARIAGHEAVDMAAPLAFGDSVGAAPVVGTIAEFARHLTDGRIEGRMWERTGEALAGAATGLAVGDRVTPAHGVGDTADDHAHGGMSYKIVGRMGPTGTPWDRSILVPIESVWQVHGLADGHAPSGAPDERHDVSEGEAVDDQAHHEDAAGHGHEPGSRLGPPFDPAAFPGTPAILVRAESLAANYGLRSAFQGAEETMAFFPGAVLSGLYRILGDIREAMSLLSLVSQALVASAVLLGLFLLMHLVRRQIALLRALGAPARFVFAVTWSFAAAMLAGGAVLAIGVGWAAAAVLSRLVTARTDVMITATLGWTEIHLVAAFVTLTSIAALMPSLAVLRQDIVEGLRS